jgi:hypothetical protein
MLGDKHKIFLECLVFPENESLWDWVAKQDHVPFDTTGESLAQCYFETQNELFKAFEKNGFGYMWYDKGKIYGCSPDTIVISSISVRVDIKKYKQLMRQLLIENILEN